VVTASNVVIGMDPHKRSATIEVMSSDETVLGGGRYATDATGYRAMLTYAKQWPDRRWAVEGSNGAGRHIAMRLVADGETVVDVPAKLSARARVFVSGQGRKTTPGMRTRSRWSAGQVGAMPAVVDAPVEVVDLVVAALEHDVLATGSVSDRRVDQRRTVPAAVNNPLCASWSSHQISCTRPLSPWPGSRPGRSRAGCVQQTLEGVARRLNRDGMRVCVLYEVGVLSAAVPSPLVDVPVPGAVTDALVEQVLRLLPDERVSGGVEDSYWCLRSLGQVVSYASPCHPPSAEQHHGSALWDTASHRAVAARSATPDARVGWRPAGRPNGRRPSGDGACGDRVPAEHTAARPTSRSQVRD
jgi:hypothetical protein